MGYIPIIIAMLAFALLLILVNLNSIRNSQQTISLAFFTVCQTAKSRHALLRRIQGIQANVLCPELPPNQRIPSSMMPQISSFVASEWTSLKEAVFYMQDNPVTPENYRYLSALEVLNHRQRMNLRIFERKVREYNQLIDSYPTAMVAFIYRISPISIAPVRK